MIESMASKCEVGFLGSASAIEKLWLYVYELKTKVEYLEAQDKKMRDLWYERFGESID